jgi:hydrogenase maturation factor
VHINANDVATFGVAPSFFSSCLLLPPKSNLETILQISEQIGTAAKKLNIAVIGGHSEITSFLSKPIVVGCALGITENEKFVTSSGSRPNDDIILTKGVGIEGTAILATDGYEYLKKKINSDILKSGQKFFDSISILNEAKLAFAVGGVNAMHDPTEGGIAGGIHELADASNLGFKLYEEKIPISYETMTICRFFQINPFHLLSSGSLLISSDPQYTKNIVEVLLANDINTSVIGKFVRRNDYRVIVAQDNNVENFTKPKSDSIYKALKKIV